MQIGDRVSIKQKRLGAEGQKPVVEDMPILATVAHIHAPFSFTVQYDETQDGCNHRVFSFQAIPETVQIVSRSRISEVTLFELRPGAIFVTRDGVRAVKTQYHYPNGQCECVLLKSGEYAHFEQGNLTMVQEVEAAAKEEYRMLMSTNDEGSITHLTRIAPKPVDFLPGQSVTFACSGPTCYKVDGDFPQLSAQTGGILQEPIYAELMCMRCGAIYLVTWGYRDVPTLVERRGWRDVESDGTWGRLHGGES